MTRWELQKVQPSSAMCQGGGAGQERSPGRDQDRVAREGTGVKECSQEKEERDP